MTTTTEAAWAVALARSAVGVGPARESAPRYAGPVVAGVAAAPGVGWVETPSGADIALVDEVVVKLHHPRTDVGELRARLEAVRTETLAGLFVQPLTAALQAPDGRWATAWPRMEVLTEDAAEIPWAHAGRLLASLHRASSPPVLPPHGGPARVERALRRVSGIDDRTATDLADLGTRLLHEVRSTATRHTGGAPATPHTVVHGDWHLGQLATSGPRLRLLDVDDLGVGDPAWDLARPAGFWAAGLLDDSAWRTFLDAYRRAGGPAVPATGDPWPRLDLAARCAVFVAAVRAVSIQTTHSVDPAGSLLEACARM
ncbi:phosphotransferase family protein [Monashia sp. NPDC004114]